MSMKAIILPGSEKAEIRVVPKPKPGIGQVLVEMKASGICRSDLHFLYSVPEEKRKEPQDFGLICPSDIISGHEPCGVVKEIGEGVHNLKIGDRVAVHHISGCGFCNNCRTGWHIVCEGKAGTYGFDRDGSNAEFMLAEERDCVTLPSEVSFNVGAWASCGAGTAYGALKRISLPTVDSIAVFGAGQVGLAVVFLAKHMGINTIIVSDFIEERLALAKKAGAQYVINAKNEKAVDTINEITNKKGVSAAIECTGSPAARNDALDSVKVWGNVVFLGLGPKTTVDVTLQFIQKQLTVIGSWVCSTADHQELLDFLAKYKLPMEDLITDRFSIDEAVKAFKLFNSGKTVGKGIFEF